MIDFFKPVDIAWERMEKCLFKPFDIGRWFTLGFCAWLASFIEGGGGGSGGGGGNSGGSSGKANVGQEMFHDLENKVLGFGLPFWVGILLLVLVVVAAFTLLFCWLGARGQFMFLDNYLHGRVEVVKPWKEFRTRAYSFFVLYAAIALATLVVIFGYVIAALFAFWPHFIAHKVPSLEIFLPWIVVLLLLFLAMVGSGIFLFLLKEFGVPMMYRDGITAIEAVGKIWELGCKRPLDYLVYLLMRFVMGILFLMLACIAGCLTCCLGFLPYLNAVITLPLTVFRLGYTLECLSQISGESYWLPEPPPLPMTEISTPPLP